MNAVEFEEELPEGWTFLPFGNIKPSTERFDPTKEDNQRYLGLEHIEKDTGKIIGSQESKTTVSLKTVFCKGDLLYGKLRPYLNKVAIPDFNGVCSTDILVFPQNPFILNTFLKLCLLKSDFVEFANRTATGVQHPRTSHKKLSNYLIPLPLLSEQRRIVLRIESIFAQIDAARERLERLVFQTKFAPGSLDILRNSVLKQAFEGKLVSHDPRDEPADIFLKKIHKDFDKKIVFENENLPKKWIRTAVNNCVEILDSKRIPINLNERKQRQGNIPYYGSTGQVGWIDDYLFDEDLVLLGEDAAPFLDHFKNKAYLVSGKSWVNNHAHVLKGFKNLLLNRFLCHFLNQFDYNEFVTGTTRLKLNQTRMRMIPILLPPLNEQKRIVAKIESIFAEIDAIEQYVKSTLQLLDQLKNSTLKQAFEGKLVPQDPNDELLSSFYQK